MENLNQLLVSHLNQKAVVTIVEAKGIIKLQGRPVDMYNLIVNGFLNHAKVISVQMNDKELDFITVEWR